MPATILVAEDEASIIDLVGLYLAREGFRVHAARDGEAAVEAARAGRGLTGRAMRSGEGAAHDGRVPARVGLPCPCTLRAPSTPPRQRRRRPTIMGRAGPGLDPAGRCARAAAGDVRVHGAAGKILPLLALVGADRLRYIGRAVTPHGAPG
jgi:CheY-like chemotaxis protein